MMQLRRLAPAVVAVALAAGAMMPASSAAAQGQVNIDVATYNVCKVNCSTKFSWAKRRKAVVRTVQAAHPAVLAVQEAPTLPWRSTNQWVDLTGLLSRIGYQPTSMEDGCTDGCTRGAHLYYDPQRIRPLPQRNSRTTGMESQRQLSGQTWGGIQDRNVSWAYLQDIATGTAFMALSVHYPNEKTDLAERLREATSQGITGWVEAQNAAMGTPNIPVVLMGDLNSFQERQPNGAQSIFEAAGYVDSTTAATRINEHYSTVNYTPATRRWKGFPPKPYRYAGEAIHIDYIFGKNGAQPVRHEVMLKLRNGKFDPAYRGSDHNLVMATMSMPTPVAG